MIRWFNYHLSNACHPKRVANFSGDIKDGENYTILLNQLNEKCDKSGLDDTIMNDRARKIIENANKLGGLFHIYKHLYLNINY